MSRPIIETCPLCLGRGTRRKTDGIYKPGRTPDSARCDACHGDGGMPRRQLQAIVRRGLKPVR